MGKFNFNGQSSEDFGLVIQTPPTYIYPERDLTNNHIPGRNGDIVIDNKCFKNVERSYQIAKGFKKGTTYYENFQSILDWLNSANGSYARLEDSYDSDIYRLASFQFGGAITNYFDEAGATEIKFNCKPQRYLKSGENTITYAGANIFIENPSRYLALPDIIIKNINTGEFGLLMMSVLDKNGNATSSIGFTNYEGTISLSSEEQTVFDQNDEDRYDVISLNGKVFPSLGGGVSNIKFAKYDIESSGIIGSYSSLIISSQVSCVAEYKTYSAIESSSQEKFLIKSYDYIVDSHKESYSASSVQTMISDNSKSYKFESFNTLLSRYAKVFQFTGTLAQNTTEKPEWLIFEGTDTIKAAVTGFFMVGISDKRIRFVKAGGTIILHVDSNAINSIYYYKALKNYTEIELNEQTYVPSTYYEKVGEDHVLSTGIFDSEKIYYTKISTSSNVIDPPHENNDNYCWLEIDYSDKPNWISYSIVYSTDSESIGSPTKINYTRAASGYYWTDKTWIFDKAQWTYYTGESYEVFASLSWNTSKKAFVANEGLSLSTTITFTYKYYNCTPTTLPDYSPVAEEVVNKDTGEVSNNTLNEIHFSVQDSISPSTLSTISIYSKEAGWYSIKTNSDSTNSAWMHFDANTLIKTSVKGTDGFEVFYLESIPDYSDQPNWPEWLNPVPVKTGDNKLSPTTIQFEVIGNAYYRFSSGSTDEIGGTDKWILVADGNQIASAKTSSDYYYLYMVESIPVVYTRNRCYTYMSGGSLITSETPPGWLNIEFSETNESGTTTPTTIKYKVGAAGYYKWDSSSTWIKKVSSDIGGLLFESSGKDDSTLYYLSELPEYGVFDLSDLFEITPKVNSIGNPTEVEYKVLSTGYYRFNNNTDWEYIISGTVLLNSKINESNRLYHLKETNDSLSGLEIVIKPRWWML